MKEWKLYKLSDFIHFNPTLSLKKGTIAKKITMDQLIPYSREIYSWVNEPYSGGAKFQNGDTIMARITPCLENGKHAYVSILDNNEIAYGSTEYFVMRGIEGVSDNLFVYYLTHYPEFKNAAIKSMVGSSGRQRAQLDVLKNLEYELPDLEEQIQIATLLSSIDDKIALNKRINDNLEQQAQALYRSWFVDFEPFKEGKFIESEIGEIPAGWSIVKFGDIVEIPKKTINPQKFPDTIFNHYSLPACDNGLIAEVQAGKDIMSNKIILQSNTTLFSKLNPRIKRIWFTCEVLPNSICSTEFIPYRAKIDTEYSYIFSIVNSDAFYSSVMGCVNGATGSHQRFHAEDTEDFLCAYNKDAVNEFSKLIEPILKQMHDLRQENVKLALTRDTLLPKLMSGELKINEIDC